MVSLVEMKLDWLDIGILMKVLEMPSLISQIMETMELSPVLHAPPYQTHMSNLIRNQVAQSMVTFTIMGLSQELVSREQHTAQQDLVARTTQIQFQNFQLLTQIISQLC